MTTAATCTPARPELAGRELINPAQARRLEGVFKMLASDTRLRLLHALTRTGELCVTDLADTAGMRPQAVSNQLQRLTDRGMLATRRDGNRIWYRITDPCITELLDLAWCLIEASQPDPAGRL